MFKVVLAAIMWLHPSPNARNLAKIVVKEVKRRACSSSSKKTCVSIHPARILTAIQHETGGTWRPRLRSRTNDYGLMQLHVGRTTHVKYQGREKLLYDPKLNIYLGTRSLMYWKRYHERKCQGKDHHWISHYNQGHRVYRKGYQTRHLKIFKALIERFWKPADPVT